MQLSMWFGLILGIGAILLGQILEGGRVTSILEGTAAAIVFGGTFGAILVSHDMRTIRSAWRHLLANFFSSEESRESIAKEIIDSALLARKESILSLEKKLASYSDPFMRSVFRFVVDGVEPQTINEIFENEIRVDEETELRASKVFMDAGGFAPTIGIIGAVLGLIHVMENLTDTSKLGQGIAVAFVATIYGVGSANLIFIPIANRIRSRIKARALTKEMILVGALGVLSGLNPYIVEEKLRGYLHPQESQS